MHSGVGRKASCRDGFAPSLRNVILAGIVEEVCGLESVGANGDGAGVITRLFGAGFAQ